MSDSRRMLGAKGEELAARFLAEAGLTILDRNWRCAAGEIDIVCCESVSGFAPDGQPTDTLACIEVRTRRGRRYGTALQSITPAKEAKLREVAEHYVQATGWQGPWRIDVVAIQMDHSGRLESVEHIRHAVAG